MNVASGVKRLLGKATLLCLLLFPQSGFASSIDSVFVSSSTGISTVDIGDTIKFEVWITTNPGQNYTTILWSVSGDSESAPGSTPAGGWPGVDQTVVDWSWNYTPAGSGKVKVGTNGRISPFVPTSPPPSPVATPYGFYGTAKTGDGVPALVGTVTIEANTFGIYEAGGFLNPVFDDWVGSGGSDVVTVNTATFTVGEVPATTEAQKLSASDADVGDWFGTSIAADGYIAVVGAYLDDDNGEDSGSAYVYQRLGTSWVQGPKLLASDGVADDQFGTDVAISTPVIAIGARASAYLFRRNGNSWTQETKLTGPAGDGFGEAIAIAGDRVVVGARYDDAGGNTHSGAAYVFRFNGVDWIEEAKLTASDAMTNNYFGTDVAIHGTTILVGANGRNSGTGAAYVFEFNGSSWVEASILTSTPTIADSWFGHAVALNHDIAAISAPLYDDAQPGAQDSGSVFMFRHNGSNWIEEAKLKRNNPLNYDFFGRGVSLSGDAILIHELQTNADDPTGGAHLFYYDGNDWLFQERYHGSGTTAEYFLIFGSSAVIAGSDALVGAPTHDGNASESGAVYVFDLPMGLVQVPSFGALGVGALCGLVALAGWRRLRAQAKTVHLHPN